MCFCVCKLFFFLFVSAPAASPSSVTPSLVSRKGISQILSSGTTALFHRKKSKQPPMATTDQMTTVFRYSKSHSPAPAEQTDNDIVGQTDRDTDRQTDRKTSKESDRNIDRQMDRKTNKDADTNKVEAKQTVLNALKSSEASNGTALKPTEELSRDVAVDLVLRTGAGNDIMLSTNGDIGKNANSLSDKTTDKATDKATDNGVAVQKTDTTTRPKRTDSPAGKSVSSADIVNKRASLVLEPQRAADDVDAVNVNGSDKKLISKDLIDRKVNGGSAAAPEAAVSSVIGLSGNAFDYELLNSGKVYFHFIICFI